MIEWIITSSALIGIVLILRLLLKRRISAKLRYGLWLLVLLRLLIPLSFPSSLSILNLIPDDTVPEQPVQTVTAPAPQRPSTEISAFLPAQPLPTKPIQQAVSIEETPAQTPITPKQLLMALWVSGMLVIGSIFVASNIHFALRLKRSRKETDVSCYVPVYQSTIVSTPCIHGVLFPKLYLPRIPNDAAQLQHILAHETAHLRQLDHIWSLLRCICFVLHWYNPLVWVAAILSRQDAELACDEEAVRRLGEEQRSAYGQTLIQITCTKNPAKDLFLTASTILVTKKSLKERIVMIAKKQKTTLIALLIVIFTVVIAVGCTFTGADEKDPSSGETSDAASISIREAGNTYIRFNGGFGGDFTITLYKDGTFKYYEGNLSSYYGIGSWTLEEGILTLKDDHQNVEFLNRFRMDEDGLTWIAAGSTGFTYGAYISIADGDIFFLQSPKPAELSYMPDISYLPQDYMDGGPLGCFLHVDGTTYVWDHNVTNTLQDMQTEEVGTVTHRDDTVIPETHLSACRIPEGTVLYKGKDAGKSKYDAIYYKLEGFSLYARMLPTDAYRGADRWWESQTIHDGSQELTTDALRKLQEEKGKQLSRADLQQYSYVTFSDTVNAWEYRLFQVDTDYRLLLVSATTVADIEALQARFYHKDIPNYWVDLMTTDIDEYQKI